MMDTTRRQFTAAVATALVGPAVVLMRGEPVERPKELKAGQIWWSPLDGSWRIMGSEIGGRGERFHAVVTDEGVVCLGLIKDSCILNNSWTYLGTLAGLAGSGK